MNKKAILEAVKEVGRLAFFAALAAVGLWLASKANLADPTSTQFLVLTALGRFIDKYVHKNEDINANGVAPF